ncbi:MAG: trimeric intracellular cation channel family protein, partial [Planctomyces sp.]
MISTIELLAVISGAVFGVLAARRKGLDLVGVVSVAMMTAFGGGSLRDLLLDRHPLFWIEHSRYPVIV